VLISFLTEQGIDLTCDDSDPDLTSLTDVGLVVVSSSGMSAGPVNESSDPIERLAPSMVFQIASNHP
jgi:hypothetical protein